MSAITGLGRNAHGTADPSAAVLAFISCDAYFSFLIPRLSPSGQRSAFRPNAFATTVRSCARLSDYDRRYWQPLSPPQRTVARSATALRTWSSYWRINRG